MIFSYTISSETIFAFMGCLVVNSALFFYSYVIPTLPVAFRESKENRPPTNCGSSLNRTENVLNVGNIIEEEL